MFTIFNTDESKPLPETPGMKIRTLRDQMTDVKEQIIQTQQAMNSTITIPNPGEPDWFAVWNYKLTYLKAYENALIKEFKQVMDTIKEDA